MNKLWYIHTEEYHSAIKNKQTIDMTITLRDFKGIMLKKLHILWPHLRNTWNIKNNTHEEQTSGCLGLRDVGRGIGYGLKGL